MASALQVLRELKTGENAQEVLRAYQASLMQQAEVEQRRSAALHQDRQHMEDGEKIMHVHPRFYHYWGQRLGYECWDDEQFVREFLRDNPEVRVKSSSRKVQVGYTPSRTRFHKKYDLK